MLPAAARYLCLATLITAGAVPIEPHNGTAVAAALVAPSVGTGGAMLETSQRFLDFMLATFVPELQSQISSLQIPDQSGKASGFDYHISGMHISHIDLSKAKIDFKQSQGLEISVPLNVEGTTSEN